MQKNHAEATACAKLILFGEHAVVYGYPAIAVPLKSLRLHVRLQPAGRDSVRAEGIGASDKRKLLQSLKAARTQMRLKTRQLRVTISSQIPFRAGLGSSAAFNVALVRALAKLGGKKLSAGRISKLAYELEKIYHGTPSGIDTAVSAYEKPVYFVKGKKLKFISLGKALNLIIANTGSRAETKEVVAAVRKRKEEHPGKYGAILSGIGSVSAHAKDFLENGNTAGIGKAMNLNQELLEELGVSSQKLNLLVRIARNSGAFGAKLSGAGKGGCVVAIAKPGQERKIVKALKGRSREVFRATVR